jgi:hypothetical protein
MLDDTTAETVKALKERLAQHEARLAENADFRAAQTLRRTITELTGEEGLSAVPRPASQKPNGKPPTGRVSQPTAAKAAILAKGRPMRTYEILAAMPDHGAVIGGKNPKGNLVSILSGNPEFSSISWHGDSAWWLTGYPKPAQQEAAE